MHAGVGLHREHDLVDGAQDLVDLADARIFVYIYRCVEIRDLGVRQLAHQVAFAVVHQRADRFHRIGRALGSSPTSAFAETAAAFAAASCSGVAKAPALRGGWPHDLWMVSPR